MKKLSLALFLVLFGVTFMTAQRTVSGMLTDKDSEPLIGASVLVKGTSVGTVTDIDGKYTIDVPAGSTNLVYSYTGFADQEITLGASNVVDVALEEGVILGEVVVIAGGLEANKRTIGYAVQNVNPDDVLAAKEVNLVNALSSKVAGVSVVSSSGSPGASSNIRIRGNTSIGGSNDPLFVVDGVPIDNSNFGNGVDGVDQSNRAIDLNPNDIASITVLKGPSATALYGVRAANGAIIVTTKRGEAGAPKINISGSYSWDKANQLPERQDIYAQGRPSGGDLIWRGAETAEGFSWGPAISSLEYDGDTTYPFDQNGRLVPAGTGNGVAAQAHDPYDFFVTGHTYDLNANVSGGTDKMRYFISGGRLSSDGIVPNSTFSRNSFRLNLEANLTDKLTASMSGSVISSGGDRIQRGSNLNGVMLGLLRTAPTFDNGNGKVGQDAADDPASYVLPNGAQRSYRAGVYDNPYWTVNKNPSTDDVNRVIGNLGLKYELTDWLTVAYKLGMDQYTDNRNSAFDINLGGFGSNAGSVSQSVINSKDLNSDLTLALNKNLSDDLSLSALVGYNVFDKVLTWEGTDGTTLSAPNFYHISNATDLTAFNDVIGKRLYGLYGTVDLNYKEFLFVNVTGRNDWSSILPKENNTFQSYSVALGFDVTEALQINNNILDYAKLRASWGQVGNDGGNAFIYATSSYFNPAFIGGDGFITGAEFPAFGTNAFERDIQLANKGLTPEKTTTIEVGTELKFFRGRLGLDVTYFASKSEDLIIAVQLSPATGFTDAVQNAATLENKGWEIVLDAGIVRSNDFNWDIAVNFTQLETDVTELAEGVTDIGLNGFTSTSVDAVVGQPFSSIYGNGFLRNDGGDVIVGSDGWPLSDPIKKALGDPNPDWTAGIKNTFTYKGISLSALIDLRQGGDMWCGTCGIMNYFGTSQQSADERDDVVVFDGVQEQADGSFAENNTPVALANPADGLGGNYRLRYGFGGITEMNIYDTSWIRLRELTVSYSLPGSMLEKTFVEGASISLTGRNLWLNTDYPGIDPETNLTGASNGYGLDYFNMPNTKSFSATVRLTF
ncbi:MAG: TonB-linked SusC/RagA family outer membrane protein [Paraglaciecola sp.]|jgi:TonB-linked SusC/RagA family outer membrane protein